MTNIADYTTKDLAADICGMRDLPYDRIIEKATKAINAAIAQAVQAEREACAQVAESRNMTGMERDRRRRVANEIAAAIRARNGAGRK